MKIEWLNKNNIEELKSILQSEFEHDINIVGDWNLYEEVLEGNKFGNIDLNYGLLIEDGRTIGILGYYIPEQDSKAAWLGWFAIKKLFRRQGLGTKAISGLINYLKKIHPELEVIRTYTTLNNAGGIDFYKAVGFEQEDNLYTIGNEEDPTVILDYNLTDGPVNQWNKIPIW